MAEIPDEIRAASVGEERGAPFYIDWDRELRRPKGVYHLNEAQKETLYQLVWTQGKGAAILAVGHGKSLLAFLLPTIFGVQGKDVMFLYPKNLERTLLLQYAKFKDHFYITMPNMVPYEIFQNKSYHKRFGAHHGRIYNPKMIIADECHSMKRASSVRFRRIVRYLQQNQDVIFIPMTGTITNRGLEDYAHLFVAAFNDGSPLPGGGQALRSWGRILDADKEPKPHDWGYFEALEERYTKDFKRGPIEIPEGHTFYGSVTIPRKEVCRAVYKRHLEQTPGLTIIGESSVASTIYIKKHKHIGIPDRILKVLKYMEDNQRLPAEGDFFETDAAAANAKAQVLQGFYYKWEWEDSVSDGDITDWKLAKSDWSRAVRQWMLDPYPSDLDSPALLVQTIEEQPGRIDRALVALYHAWKYERERVPPPETVGVWLDDYLIEWVDKWQRSMPPSLIWYSPRIVGKRLSSKLSLIQYGAGSPPPEEGMEETGTHTGVATISHRRGLNLQAWRHHLIVSPPASGSVYEQLFGRSHRYGQTEDVRYDIVAHHHVFEQKINQAIRDAEYAEQSTGMQQKLLYAAWI